MANLKLGNEMWEGVMINIYRKDSQGWDKENNLTPEHRTPGGGYIHWARRTHGEQGQL